MTRPTKVFGLPKAVTLDSALRWLMIAASFTFLILYAAALAGWLRPTGENSLPARLEPIIFLIMGFYFGQMTASSIGRTLRKELSRALHKLETCQIAKEQVHRERDSLAEKVGNANVALDRMFLDPKDCDGSILGGRTIEIVRKILNS